MIEKPEDFPISPAYYQAPGWTLTLTKLTRFLNLQTGTAC